MAATPPPPNNSAYQTQAGILLSNLKEIVDKQHAHTLYLEATIESLSNQVKDLQSRNTFLDGKVEQLEKELSTERSKSRRHKRKTSLSRKPSTSSIDENRIPSISSSDGGMTLKSNSVSRSNSFQRKLLEEREGSMKNDYELSSDLKDRQVEAIRNFYGGEKSDQAARIIQYAYREYQMRRNFLKIRHSSTRRRLTIDYIKPADLPAAARTATNNHNKEDKSCLSDTEICYHTTTKKIAPPSVIITTNGHPPEEEDEVKVAEEEEEEEEVPEVVEESAAPTTTDETDGNCIVETSFAKGVANSNGDDVIAIPPPPPQLAGDGAVSEDVTTDVVVVTSPTSPPGVDHMNPPTEEEIVKRILANDPVMPYMDPSSSMYQTRKQRKRHGYETVAEILPAAEPNAMPVSPPPTITTLTDQQEVLSHQVVVIPEVEVSPVTPTKQSPQGEVARTSSENSLQSTEVEGDRESIKSYDTSSITSEMSASTSTSVSAVSGGEQGYHRRSTISRESWHVENDVLRKRLYRIGLNLFNRKPTKGLDFLIDKQFVVRTPPAIANFLLNRKGLSRQMVGEYLGSPQNFCRQVLDAVCELMDFNDMDIDQALRNFQSQIRVQGEAQKVERLIEAFSQRYCTCNPVRLQTYKNPDAIFIVAYAIIMLNTDLHSPNMKNERRMTEQGFIKNLRGIDNGDDLSEEMLLNVYTRIKESELTTLDDHVSQVLQVENNIVGKKPTLAVPHRRLVCFCRLFQVHDPNKPQKAGVHQREVFLFNDMILITKMLQKKKIGTTYTFKQSLPLHGLSFLLFENSHYPNGVRLVNALDNKSLMAFNAPNETDRAKFVTDLRESIAEVEQMEGMRIGAELEKAHTSGMSPTESRRSSLSLVDTKKMSASMQNLNVNGGIVNMKTVDVKMPDLPGPNIRPTSMYAMGGVNLNNNNNSSSNNSSPQPTQRNNNTHRLPSVIGNLLSKQRPSSSQQQQQKRSHINIFHHHTSDSSLMTSSSAASVTSSPNKLNNYVMTSQQQQRYIPHSEV